MTQSSGLSRERLMRFYDGELSEEEARAVEAELEGNPELLDELEAYTQLGSFVRASNQHTLDSARELDISESVMQAIASAARPMPVPRLAKVHALWPRVASFVTLGAAVAAGSLLVIRSWSTPHRVPAAPASLHATLSSSSTAAPPSSAAEQETQAQADEPQPFGETENDANLGPATIESVDFGSNTGTVFVVSTDSSETPVVWMPDDADSDEDNEDRSESL